MLLAEQLERGHMSLLKDVAADANTVSSPYVPSLQRTEGQPPPEPASVCAYIDA